MSKTVLLVNPWIRDFAAYDLWVFPLGLLKIAACLRHPRIHVKFIDCLDRYDKSCRSRQRDVSGTAAYGTGHFYKEKVEKPEAVNWMPRDFFQYGISQAAFEQKLHGCTPDLILVTSGMTYWYAGVQRTIALLRERFKNVPILLGGIYAALCPEHARALSGADEVFSGADIRQIAALISEKLGVCLDEQSVDPHAIPAFELLPSTQALPILGSFGCPFRCTYCASRILYPQFIQEDPETVFRRIMCCVERFKAGDFVFYDDALLFEAERFIKPLLRRIVQENLLIRFHTPNGLHARFIDQELAELMFAAHFKTLRLSLESASGLLKEKSSAKVTNEHIRQAVIRLYSAGFSKEEIGIYTMIGFPGQKECDIIRDMRFVNELGAQIHLSSYSLVPQTIEWQQALQKGTFHKDIDPLLLGHTVFPLKFSGFSALTLKYLRRKAGLMNKEPFGVMPSHNPGFCNRKIRPAGSIV